MTDVALITCKDLLQEGGSLHPKDRDGCHLMDLLTVKDISVQVVAWDDASIVWSNYDNALVSSTWNYHNHPKQFSQWLDHIMTSGCRIFNHPDLLRWNMSKKYLLDLASWDIPIPVSYFVDSPVDLEGKDWPAMLNRQPLVMKPIISASAQDTYLVDHPSKFTEVATQFFAEERSFLIQPLLSTIRDLGEISIVFINGVFTHAMRKVPAVGDFRVQREFGGSIESVQPQDHEIIFAQNILHQVSVNKGTPTYARIDICADSQGNLIIMELELIEPELWLSDSQVAAEALVHLLIQ